MAESHTIVALRDKRDNIERMIAAYTKKIEDGRRDLAHVNATIRLFEIGRSGEGSSYVDTMRLFKRGEIVTLCKAALVSGPLDTRELGRHVIKAKGFDPKDDVLRKSLTYRIVQAMRMQWKRGRVKRQEKRAGVIVWRL
jgi:hypothetical protein